MVKKYVEVTIAVDDTNPDVVEVFTRTKEDEGAWSEPSEVQNCAPTSKLGFPWVRLEIKKV